MSDETLKAPWSSMRNDVHLPRLEDLVTRVRAQPHAAKQTFVARTSWQRGTRTMAVFTEMHLDGENKSPPARRFAIEMDEPLYIGGADDAPNPGEVLLAALAGCVTAGTAITAATSGVQLDKLELELEADMDLRGFMSIDPSVPSGITDIRYTVKIDSPSSEAAVRRIKEIIDIKSPMRNTLERPVRVTSTLEHTKTAPASRPDGAMNGHAAHHEDAPSDPRATLYPGCGPAVPMPMMRALGSDELRREVQRNYGAYIELLNSGAAERDRNAEPLSTRLLKRAGDLGLCSFTLPAAHDGQGRSMQEWCGVLEEIGYLCDETTLMAFLAQMTSMQRTFLLCRDADLDRYLRRIGRGESFVGFLWTEGTDAFSFKTTATPVAQGFKLNGVKRQVNGATLSDTLLVFAKHAETGDTVALLVDRTMPGIEITPTSMVGFRAAAFGNIAFHDVFVPAERVLATKDALSIGQAFLNLSRLQIACWLLGRMRRLFERVVLELNKRIRFGLPVTEMQAVQSTIGRMWSALETSRLIVGGALERVGDEDIYWDARFSLAKYQVVEHGLFMWREAQRILGGAALLTEGPFERFMRETHTLIANAGTQLVLEIDLGVLAVDEVSRRAQREASNPAR